MKPFKLLAISLTTLSIISSSEAGLFFYEDFTGFTAGQSSLDGQGGWNSPGDSQLVQNGNIFGGINGNWNGTITNSATSGGNFLANADSNLLANRNTFGDIALSSVTTNSFVSGTTTWLSYVSFNANGGASARHSLGIGAAPLTGNRGIEMAGHGIGVSATNGNSAQATYWIPAAGDDKNAAPTNIGGGRPVFIIAKIDWDSAAAGGNDVLTVKRFSQNDGGIPVGFTEAMWDLEAALSTNNANLDQSTFDTLSFASDGVFFDDIRIASDFASAVIGTTIIPEPSSAILVSLGGGLLLLRRRR